MLRFEPRDGQRPGTIQQLVLGSDHQPAAGEPLADVVVRLADQRQVNARGREGTEALARGTVQLP